MDPDPGSTTPAATAFRDRGYWVARQLLPADGVARLAGAVDRALAGECDYDSYPWLGPPQPVGRLDFLAGVWWVSAEVRRLVLHGPLGRLAAELLGVGSVRLFFDQALRKPPQVNSAANVGWHQDAAHWEVLDTSEAVTAWIPMQSVSEENGTLRVVEGSHHWGVIQGAHTFGERDLNALRRRYESPEREWRERALLLAPGDVSFHHARTLHGSTENRSAAPRVALSVSFIPDGAALVAGGRYHQTASLLGPWARHGDPFDGPFFPQVWPTPAADPEPDPIS